MRHLPPSLFLVTGVPASVSWWHFQPSFHPSEKWMAWQERYQMSCRASQWICHWVWLLPEWIVIYLYGSLVMLTDLLPSTPHIHPAVDRLSRSFVGSLAEVPANVATGPSWITVPLCLTPDAPHYIERFPFIATQPWSIVYCTPTLRSRAYVCFFMPFPHNCTLLQW